MMRFAILQPPSSSRNANEPASDSTPAAPEVPRAAGPDRHDGDPGRAGLPDHRPRPAESVGQSASTTIEPAGPEPQPWWTALGRLVNGAETWGEVLYVRGRSAERRGTDRALVRALPCPVLFLEVPCGHPSPSESTHRPQPSADDAGLIEKLRDLDDTRFGAVLWEDWAAVAGENTASVLLELSRLVNHRGLVMFRRHRGDPGPDPALLQDAGFTLAHLDKGTPPTTAATPAPALVARRTHVPDVGKLCRHDGTLPFHEDVARRLAGFPGVRVENLDLPIDEFLAYDCIDPHSPPTTVHEKSLEYYLSEQLLAFTPNDTFIDIASLSSPFPGHVSRKHGCAVYRQDLYHYEAGIHGDRIGGDATQLPVPDRFCTKLSLHCSFEHFEGRADTGFLHEAARILEDGGRLFIGPLYMAPYYRLEYDHSREEDGEEKLCLPGCQYTRTYDIDRLCTRVLIPAREEFEITLVRVRNLPDLARRLPAEAAVYCHLCLLLTRRPRTASPPSGRSERRPFTRESSKLLPHALFGALLPDAPPASDESVPSGGASLSGSRERSTARLLVIHERVPEDDSSGSDFRLLRVIERLRHAGHDVTFIGRNGDRAARYQAKLESLGVDVRPADPDRMRWLRDDPAPPIDLPRLLTEGNFDAAILCTWFWIGLSAAEQYLPLIRKLAPELPIIALSDDLHWYREALRAQVTGRRIDLEVSRCLRVKENEVYRAADMVLAITEEDAARMKADCPEIRLRLLRHTIGELPPPGPGRDARTGLLFLGSGLNEANERAVRWFMEAIFPKIRRDRPDITLQIVGQPPIDGWPVPQDARGVTAIGQVDDLVPHFHAARIFVSPITYGTGLKTKNVLAMAHGIPLVTTCLGAEGMDLVDGKNAFVRDDPAGFAAAVVRLLDDDETWERIAAASRDHIRNRFGTRVLDEDIRGLLEELQTLRPGLGVPFLSALHVEQSDPESCFSAQPLRLLRRANAHVELARRYVQKGRPDLAAHELRLVLSELRYARDQAPLAPIHANLAAVYRQQGEMQEAERSLEEAARLRSSAPSASGLSGQAAAP